MVMKKGSKVPMKPAPSSSSYAVRERARARSRYQSLFQDYEELLKETEAKRKRLQDAKQRKLKLLAEVKFLGRKFKCLSKNPSQRTAYRLKKQPHKNLSPLGHNARVQNFIIPSEAPLKDNNSSVKRATIPSTSAVLDLNQILPIDDETEEFQVKWEPLKTDKLKTCSAEGETKANDLKLLICRDVGDGVNQVGKRKITWQDQVALRV